MTYAYATDIEHALTVPEWIERGGVEVQNPDYLALEAKARRLATSQDLRLMKCRTRNPEAPNFGGFMLIEPMRNLAIAGTDPWPYSLSLADVFQELQPEPEQVVSHLRLVSAVRG